MNKIASLFYLMQQHIPTLDFYPINRKTIEEDIQTIYHHTPYGWVIRCGRHPHPHGQPEPPLPWHVSSSLEKIIKTIKDFYRQLRTDYYVFIHPQREMTKSGNLFIHGDTILIEAVKGWPEGLSHGTQSPQARYIFKTPSLFLKPSQIEGNPDLLTPQELLRIGKNIERKLDYTQLSLTQPVIIEFSLNRYSQISAHDVRF